jgi:hypothetical protein
MKTARSHLFTIILTILVGLPLVHLAAQDLPARQNIDDLSPEKIGVLKAAMAALKADPDAYKPLQYWHDGGNYKGVSYPGCMHGSEAFLSWHRELLRRFEIALQNTGVPGAKDIMLPYWDWSQPFKGGRYPAIAEDTASPFYALHRNTDSTGGPLSVGDVSTALGEDTWVEFGGTPGGPGALESPPHNNMHSLYVGGYLTFPNTAAQDPVFWLFHCGIDYFWWKWQQDYPDAKPANGSTALRGFKGKTIDSAWSVKKMGYTYKDKKILLDEGLLAMAKSVNATAMPKMAMRQMDDDSFDVKIPKPGFEKAELHIDNVKAAGAGTHTIDYYLYPANLEFRKNDPEFAKTYIAARGSHFGTPQTPGKAMSMHHPPRITVRVNVTKALAKAAASHAGEIWKFTVVYRGVTHPISKQKLPVLLGRDVSHGAVHLVLD